jgi:hypothetical protein
MGSCHFAPQDGVILPWSCSGYNSTRAAPPQHPHFAPRVDYRRGDPRSMVPVRLAGAEVTEAFWAKAAVLS